MLDLWYRVARGQQEIVSHLGMAQKYISELDYEQTIAEYTAAQNIDPNNESIRQALEQVMPSCVLKQKNMKWILIF